MRSLMLVLVLVLALCATCATANRTTYGFFREVAGASGGAAGARRVFGGAAAQLSEFPTACALLDRYFATRCSAAALAPHWALTAAHCVSPMVAYVKYNTRRPATEEGDVTAIHYLYRHPEYRVVQADEGYGMDVTVLHNDVGLVRARDELRLRAPLPRDALAALRRYDPISLLDAEVQVLGFGRSESSALGEEMWGARLRLVRCGRSTWYHVVCGASTGAGSRAGGEGGVCAGDSGGPMLFGHTQLAVTSLGPRECGGAEAGAGEGAPPSDAISVFTTLRPYVDVLNATIADTDATLRMRMISDASHRPHLPTFIVYIVLGSLLAGT